VSDDPLLVSLLAAVSDRPADLPLRLHVARLLLERGRPAQAVQQCAAVLAIAPADPDAVALLAAASAALGDPGTPGLRPRLGLRPRPGRPRPGLTNRISTPRPGLRLRPSARLRVGRADGAGRPTGSTGPRRRSSSTRDRG
jgi:hypothetical protein